MLSITRNLLGCLCALLLSGTALAQTQQPAATPSQPSSKTEISQPAPGGDSLTGTGNQNRVVKWMDNVGTLGDSTITEMSGSVGIGNTNPAAKLDVSGNALIGSTKANIGASGNGVDYPSIGYNVTYSNTSNTHNYRIADSATLLRFGNGSSANKRAFEFKAATVGAAGNLINFSELMTILYNGNVGIGTTNPTYKLEVTGNIKISGAGNGIFFADGTSMTTAPLVSAAGLSSVTHDTTLTGSGTGGSPLGLADGAVTVGKLSATPTASGQVLTYNGTGLSWEAPAAGGSPTVFKHTRTTRCGPFDEFSEIDHPLLNGNPDAMIFVTALIGINDSRTNTNSNQNLVVTYSGSTDFGTCPANRWLIRGGDISDGAKFNVMVVVP